MRLGFSSSWASYSFILQGLYITSTEGLLLEVMLKVWDAWVFEPEASPKFLHLSLAGQGVTAYGGLSSQIAWQWRLHVRPVVAKHTQKGGGRACRQQGDEGHRR